MNILEAPDYVIFDDGEVFNKNIGGIVKSYNNHNGYKFIRLQVNKQSKQFLIHRLIAAAYIPNPNNLPIINHIDCNRSNNKIENLEWCTHLYNCQSINTVKSLGYVEHYGFNKFCSIYTYNKVTYRKKFSNKIEAECYLVLEEIILKLTRN